MKFAALTLTTLALGTSILSADTWTRASDGRTITADLLAFNAETNRVTLKLSSGKESTFDASILSPDDQQRLAQFAEEEAKRIEASKHGRMESLTPENGGGHKIHIYRPPGYIDNSADSKTRPVVFVYHYRGKSQDIVEHMKLTADELGWVVVGVDAYTNTKSLEDRYDERLAQTKAAFACAQQAVNFDPNKIVFTGMSGGSWWSFQSTAEIAPEAAGVISHGGWMGNMYDQSYPRKMAVAIINGDKDKNAISYETKDTNFLEKKTRAKVRAWHFPGGHVMPTPELTLEAARWIHETKGF
ncbi:dienelactone hydrolase family protein [Sulfuriroseicoccus oceanibius]|uniref:Dienelactone hydrolase domain-containing protein n=1 Tax=Sulfuriroseicoccus oceanibius TaxID=2707525 RepID=A0A6B3L9M2_9BACT|nr:hypothetical protein [Sulfuriroseicoccus oceanibius]QQL44136.1 hypothetical protein G3M56_009535 [Sulfuriroseicoccus oceanibius]